MTVYRIGEDRLFFAPFEAGASGFKEVLASCEQNREGLRAILGVRDRIVFLFVGNLHVFKGVSCLIEAASLLPPGTDYECIFAGPEEPKNIVGGTIEYYMNLARKFGIENRVRFLGSLPPHKLVEWYIASDVVVLPTQRDMFPKVLVEGGLASKPLITTSACGAAGTIVLDGENGFVVEPTDPSSLSVAMAAMLDAGLRESMGRRSKKIIDVFCNRESETKGFASAILHALKT
jgi:glycosyltransferase involved in cell wall biosynthesis